MGEVYGVLPMKTEKFLVSPMRTEKSLQKLDLNSCTHFFTDNVNNAEIIKFLMKNLIHLKNGDIVITEINSSKLQIYFCNHQFFVSAC
mgnify:CR=1 FL=1